MHKNQAFPDKKPNLFSYSNFSLIVLLLRLNLCSPHTILYFNKMAYDLPVVYN